jgi:hypothetical protein
LLVIRPGKPAWRRAASASAPNAGSDLVLSRVSRLVRPGLPRYGSWRARLPEAAAIEEQIDAIIRPGVELGLDHRLAEAEGAALGQRDDDLEELLGGEFRAVVSLRAAFSSATPRLIVLRASPFAAATAVNPPRPSDIASWQQPTPPLVQERRHPRKPSANAVDVNHNHNIAMHHPTVMISRFCHCVLQTTLIPVISRQVHNLRLHQHLSFVRYLVLAESGIATIDSPRQGSACRSFEPGDRLGKVREGKVRTVGSDRLGAPPFFSLGETAT